MDHAAGNFCFNLSLCLQRNTILLKCIDRPVLGRLLLGNCIFHNRCFLKHTSRTNFLASALLIRSCISQFKTARTGSTLPEQPNYRLLT